MVQSIEERLKKKRESAKIYRENNKEKIAEYYQNNKEKLNQQGRERYENNIEHCREMCKKWRESNPEHRREYYQNNKEKEKKDSAEYYQSNKEKIKEYNENNKEKFAEYHKIYSQTPIGKKVAMMTKWRGRGVINVTDEMYNHYVATTHCECCSKEFSSSRDRHLDHDHETGEYRWVICCSCNNQDNWKKVIGYTF